jgi:hypothetical protein
MTDPTAQAAGPGDGRLGVRRLTGAGQTMVDWLNHMQRRTGWAGVPGTPAVARIEDVARREFLDELVLAGVVTTAMSYDEIAALTERLERRWRDVRQSPSAVMEGGELDGMRLDVRAGVHEIDNHGAGRYRATQRYVDGLRVFELIQSPSQSRPGGDASPGGAS